MKGGGLRFIAALIACIAFLLFAVQAGAAALPLFVLPFVCIVLPPLTGWRAWPRTPVVRRAPDPHSGPAPFRAPPA